MGIKISQKNRIFISIVLSAALCLIFYQAEFCYTGTEADCLQALQRTLNVGDGSVNEDEITIVGMDFRADALYAGFRLEQDAPYHGFLMLKRGLNHRYALQWITYASHEYSRGIYYCADHPIYSRDFLVVMGDECDFDFYTTEYKLSYEGRLISLYRDYAIGPKQSFLRFIEKDTVQPTGLELKPYQITANRLWFDQDSGGVSAQRSNDVGIGIDQEAYFYIITILILEGIYLLTEGLIHARIVRTDRNDNIT